MTAGAQWANALYHNGQTVISAASNSSRLITQIFATAPLANNVFPAGCFFYQLKEILTSAVEVVPESAVRGVTGTTTN